MKLKKLSAWQELGITKQAQKLLPALLRQELDCESAWALANNTALLCLALGEDSPKAVLERLSLAEVATGCKQVQALQAGKALPDADGFTEFWESGEGE